MERNTEFWAFAETVDRTRGSIRARFDLLPRSAELEKIVRMPISERELLFRESMIRVLTIEASEDYSDKLLKLTGGRLRESAWYRLKIRLKPADKEFSIRMYDALAAPDSTPVGLGSFDFLDGRSHEGRLLNSIFSLSDFPASGPDEILAAFKALPFDLIRRLTYHYLQVGVYDVGQGNANAVCARNIILSCLDCSRNPLEQKLLSCSRCICQVPLIYFDLGGGCAFNAKTYPAKCHKQFCWVFQPPVVLSHWDFDHYFSGTFIEESWNSTWVVPYQRTIGPTARKMIANITHAGGQVLVWNRPPWDFQLGAIKMSRPAPNSNSKNNLGIVLRVDIHQQKTDEPWPVLLTGDICYKYLPSSLTKDIQALLATHHGANRYVGQPPAASGAAIVAYSYGKGNTYGHPTNIAIQEHFAQGWNTRFDTPNGNIMLSPKSISYSIPCCNKCGL